MARIKQVEVDETWLWIGGVLTTLFLIVFVWGRMAGKRDNNEKIEPKVKPITVVDNSGAIEWDPTSLLKRTHTAFVEDWWFGDTYTVLKEMHSLQDIQLRALASAYKQAYPGTLRTALVDGNVVQGRVELYGIITRLDALGID